MGQFFSRARGNNAPRQQQPQNPPAQNQPATQPPSNNDAGGNATDQKTQEQAQPSRGTPAAAPADAGDPAPAEDPAPVDPQPEPEPQPDPEPAPAVDPAPVEADPPAEEPAQPAPEPEQPAPEQPAVEEPAPEPQPEPEPEPQPEPAVDPAPAEPAPVVEEPPVEQPPAEVQPDAKEDMADPPAVDAGPQIAVRKEIREMSPEEQNRFFDAFYKMMENKAGPGTSEFFRIAGYHGNPGNAYCSHGVEAFPGWHRIYLLEFQNALQAADRANGNDGVIGLPYWDWTVNSNEIPPIIREKYGEFPAGLFPDNNDERWPSLARNNDTAFASRMRRSRVVQRSNECLLATQHWAHASTANSRNSRYPSLENPHNMVHVACGSPMNSVSWAAFDICFWLHHCNIDRIYEAYLELEPDSAQEFEMFQNNQRRDLFDTEFEPFRKPNGDRYSPKDTFSTVDLGYQYAQLPGLDAQALQEAPTYAIFEQIRIVEMEGHCYELHVFAVPAANAEDWAAPEDPETWEEDAAYAGFEVVFGKGPGCEACKVRPPYDLRVDISAALRNQGISRYDVALKVMTIDTTDNMAVRPVEETPVPVPVVDGPLFDDRESPLEEATKDAARPEDVRALQEYLVQFGYYAADVDGDFGPVTDKAVRKYQELAGLEVDGQVGPLTKKQILSAIRCGERDVEEGATVENAAELEFAPPRDQGPYYGGRKEISYSVGVVPGYLQRDAVLGVLEGVFGQYSEAAGLTFNLTEDEEKSDIKVSWLLGAGEKKSVRFDGAGGVLARGGDGFLQLDEAERWSLNPEETGTLEDRTTWRRGDPLVLFQHVALHELGHAFGLGHSNNRDDVMAPYYNPGLVVLSEDDKRRVAAIYADAE